MIITARFKGKSSLGYISGKRYILQVKDKRGMSVKRFDGTGKCPYESISAFLQSWDDIQNVTTRMHLLGGPWTNEELKALMK